MKTAANHTRNEPHRAHGSWLCATMLVITASIASAGVGDRADQLAERAGKGAEKARAGGKKAVQASKDPMARILALAEQARESAEAAREQMAAIASRVELGSQFLEGDTLEQVSRECRSAVAMIRASFEGRDRFVSEECQRFRADLVAFLTDIQTLRQEMRSLASPGCFPTVSVERTPLIDMIERLPDGFLYPVWKGLPPGFECLVEDLRGARESLWTIREIGGGLDGFVGLDVEVGRIFRETDAMALDAELFAARLDGSRRYLEHYDRLALAAGQLQKLALSFEVLGAAVDAMGETNVKGTVGVHGYALLEVESNAMKSLGEVIKSTGKVSGKLASFVNGKLGEAKAVSAVHLILTNQEKILQNQEAILNGRQ